MTTEQIYTLVNEVNAEAFGANALSVVDTSTLISLGNTVLNSSTNTEAFLNTLAQRIGRTILRFRDYRNKLGDMVLNDFEYGAILQKIKVRMPQAEEDEMYDLINGQSVDHYKVAKPDASQKLFVTRTISVSAGGSSNVFKRALADDSFKRCAFDITATLPFASTDPCMIQSQNDFTSSTLI